MDFIDIALFITFCLIGSGLLKMAVGPHRPKLSPEEKWRLWLNSPLKLHPPAPVDWDKFEEYVASCLIEDPWRPLNVVQLLHDVEVQPANKGRPLTVNKPTVAQKMIETPYELKRDQARCKHNNTERFLYPSRAEASYVCLDCGRSWSWNTGALARYNGGSTPWYRAKITDS